MCDVKLLLCDNKDVNVFQFNRELIDQHSNYAQLMHGPTNCVQFQIRVDHNIVVKVADFGLSRDIFNADYYKGDDKAALPVRWMAVESLQDRKFSSKSDVVSLVVSELFLFVG